MTSPAPTRFINPEILSRISNLALLARGVVEGFIAGLHRSPYKGFSVDFVSYRPYLPGDDPLRIDWKLYARSDRLYIKEFEDETNAGMRLMVDVSGSMAYTSGGVSKQEYAFYLAASLAHLMMRQRDAVGLTLFDEKIRTRIPPKSSRGHLQTLLQHMEQAKSGSGTTLGKPLHELADATRRRGFVVLISDMLAPIAPLLEGLKHFRFLGHEVLLFHILDPQELEFEFTDLVEFEDVESGEKMLVSAEDAQAQYQANLNAHLQQLRQTCGTLGIDYTLLSTKQPLDFALFNYLAARRKKA